MLMARARIGVVIFNKKAIGWPAWGILRNVRIKTREPEPAMEKVSMIKKNRKKNNRLSVVHFF